MQLKSYSIDFTKKERHSFTMVRTLTSNALGDRGNEFFIILKGSVGVKIPKIVEQSLTNAEYIQYVTDNMNDLIFEEDSMSPPPISPSIQRLEASKFSPNRNSIAASMNSSAKSGFQLKPLSLNKNW